MKIRSILFMILPAILIAGLLLAGMSTRHHDEHAARGEDVAELLEETLEEECLCGSAQAVPGFLHLVERVRVAEQCSADALAFLPENCSTFGLSGWMVPLRI